MADEWNNWLKVAEAMTPACREAVTNTAKAGELNVQVQIIMKDLIETGNMLSSVYASTPDGSSYKVVDRGLAEVRPESETEAYIGVSADYAIFPNYGTIHQSAKPFWEPGIAETEDNFQSEMTTVAQKLEDAGR